jgi:leader peptidase (prepilin peptidase)/N-methyltransferase
LPFISGFSGKDAYSFGKMDMMGYILAGMEGLAVGSLLNVVITCLSQDEPSFSGAFRCQHCHHPLSRHLLLPLLGYAWSHGHCRCCGVPLPWRYPAVELAAVLLGLTLWWRFPGNALLVVYGPFFAALLVLSVLDLQYYWLPDIITLPGITLGLASALVFPQLNFRYAFLGAALSYALFRLVGWTYEKMTRGKRFGLGRGDAKLLAFIGAVLGLQALPLVLFVSAVLGSLAGLVVAWRSGEGRFASIPYGPFLAVGALLFFCFKI